jgi:hypothetical protein
VPDIFDEVSEDLRADRARSVLRRFGGLMIAAMLITLAAVGGYTWWQDQQQESANTVALRFLAAQKASERALPPKDLAQQFADIAAHGPDGYRLLASFQLAALDWDAGRHDKATAAWHAISADTHAPQLLRDLATVTSVQHRVDSGDAAALKAELLPVVQGNGAFKPMAVQVQALLDLRLGRTKEATVLMRSLLADPNTPQGLRQLTQSLMLAIGTEAPGGGQ